MKENKNAVSMTLAVILLITSAVIGVAVIIMFPYILLPIILIGIFKSLSESNFMKWK